MKSLPEAAHKDPNITKYKSAEEFYKGHTSLVETVGKKGVIVPGENATQEDMDKFYAGIGRPANPTDYKFDTIENLHPSIKSTPESIAAFQNISHQLGLRPDQANGMNRMLLEAVNSVVVEHERKQTEAAQAAEANLRKAWGPNYDANRKSVDGIALRILGPEKIKAMGGAEGLGNNPYFQELIHALSSRLSEDTLKNIPGATQTGAGAGELSKEEATAKKAEMDDPNSELYKALMDERNPKHDEAVVLRTKIYQTLYGQGAAA